jgi:hypothetical protein
MSTNARRAAGRRPSRIEGREAVVTTPEHILGFWFPAGLDADEVTHRGNLHMGNVCEHVRIGCALLLALVALTPCPASSQSAAGAHPAVCRIGVNIEDLYDFDLARETFGAVLWLWSLCPSADPAPLETIVFRTALPGLQLGEVHSTLVEGGGLYQYRRVHGTFRHDWDMSRYPFDRHRLVIPFDESDLGAAVVVFEPDVGSSLLSPEVRSRLGEWKLSDLELRATISEEASTYGLPDAEPVGYAHLDAIVHLERTQLLAFFKLTAGVFAAALIAFLSFFIDLRDRGSFNSKLGLLVAVLFAVLINLRASDAAIGDATRLTLVTEVHLVTLALIIVIALAAVRDRRRADHELPVRYPNWPLLTATAGIYVLINVGLVARAAWG